MVIIHPTAIHEFHQLVALQQRTGMRIVIGNTFYHLVHDDGDAIPVQARRMPQPAQVSSYTQGPTGGDAA